MKKLVAPLLVIFIAYCGYALVITVFTPLFLHAEGGLMNPAWSSATRGILLGLEIAIYPLAQFLGAPVLGALSDRYGRRPFLLASVACGALFFAVMALAVVIESLWLLFVATALAGLADSNVAIGQSAVADLCTAENRHKFFGYI